MAVAVDVGVDVRVATMIGAVEVAVLVGTGAAGVWVTGVPRALPSGVPARLTPTSEARHVKSSEVPGARLSPFSSRTETGNEARTRRLARSPGLSTPGTGTGMTVGVGAFGLVTPRGSAGPS